MDKMKSWIVPITFLALPFMFLSPGLIWKSQLLFFLICPVIIIAVHIKNVWVRAFLLYATIWQLFIFISSFNYRTFSPGVGLSVLFSLMAGAIIFKFISEGDLEGKAWHGIIRAAVIIQILIAIPQHFGFSPIAYFVGLFTPVKETLPGHLVGSLGNRNFLAVFIAMSVPFFVGWRTFTVKGITVNPALIIIFIFLGFCLSPGTLAAVLGMAFLIGYRTGSLKKMAVIGSVAMIGAVSYAAAYIMTTGNHANEFTALPAQLKEFFTTGIITLDPFQGDVGRFAMWMKAISQLLRSWVFMVFGCGPSAFWGRQYPIHGEYVSMLFQYGLIGLVLLIGYLVTNFRFLWRTKNVVLMTALLILCLDMVGNYPMEIASTAFMAIIVCGLIERERLKNV